MFFDFNDDPVFNIINVAQMCGLYDLEKEGNMYTTICPFCGARKGHFYLTPCTSKNYKNVYNCLRCGESGSQLKLYCELTNCPNKKEAYKQIKGEQIAPSTKKYIKEIKEAKKFISKNKLVDIDTRDTVYRLLLSKLSLYTKHYQDLIARGLSPEEIIANNYKSLPKHKGIKKRICQDILQYKNLQGIPGFYLDSSKQWTFWTPKTGGFLIPVLDAKGKIQGLQIRKDNAPHKKYVWFASTYMENGTASKSFVHVRWNKYKNVNKVVITEGPLKADISSYLTDTTFIALAGVRSFSNIKEVLEEIKPKHIYIAYDMDRLKNEHVLKAQQDLKKYIEEMGFKPKISSWNPKFKGIDDYLYYLFFLKKQNFKQKVLV